MVLCGKQSTAVITEETRELTIALDLRAKQWARKQYEIMLKKKKEMEEKKIQDNGKLTQKIASAEEWGGPFHDTDSVRKFMENEKRSEKDKKKIIRTELQIKRDIAKISGVTSQNFKMNKLSTTDLAKNLVNVINQNY